MALIGPQPNQVPVNGMLGNMAWQDADAVDLRGGRAAVQVHRAPVFKTSAFSVAPGESVYIVTGSASVTVTLPPASLNLGRELLFLNRAAFSIVSASANVIPRAGGSAVSTIVGATAGQWALLTSDGTSWHIIAA